MDAVFAVVVSGKLRDNTTQEQVRQVLAQKYNVPDPQVNRLLSGKRLIVKRDMDRDSALALARKFQAAGLECGVADLSPRKQASPPPEPSESPMPVVTPMILEDDAPPPIPEAALDPGLDDELPPPIPEAAPGAGQDDESPPPLPELEDDLPQITALPVEKEAPEPEAVPLAVVEAQAVNTADEEGLAMVGAVTKDEDEDWPPEPPSPAAGATSAGNADTADDVEDPWPPEPPPLDAPSSKAASGEPDAAQVVPLVLTRYGEAKGAYPGRSAPPKMFVNALTACFLTDEQPIHGILDTSIGKTGKECLVFAHDGINYSMGKKKKGFIPYAEFMHMELEVLDANNLLMGGEHNLMLCWGMPMRPGEAILLLQDLQQGLKGTANGASADQVAEEISSLRARPDELDKAMAFIMGPFVGKQGIQVAPDIPDQRFEEARQAGHVALSEKPMALISLKIMGKWDKFLLFTDKGLHYRQGSYKRGFIGYDEFPSLEFVKGNIGEIKLDRYATIDISSTRFKWYQLTAILGALQDWSLQHVLKKEPFKEPVKARMRCPRCASANLGLTTKNKMSYTWGFVGYFLASPIPVVGASAATAKTMAEAFGKTVYYIACRNCGHGWVDKTNAAKGEKAD